MKPASRQQGFTLIELASVLVIIGLIIGGIILARDMIRSAQIKGVISEVANYKQAIVDFRDKYQALPGDYAAATSIWGAAHAVAATCWVTVGTGTQTCDGDGNGRITTQSADTTATQYEQFRAWQHLSNAKMIDRSFSGTAGAVDPQDAVPGTNVPPSSMTGGGYAIISLTSTEDAASTHYYPINYQHMIQFGADLGVTAPSSLLAPILSPAEAASLDSKTDDGYPGSGMVMGPQKDSGYAPNCTDSDTASSARYNTSQSGVKCSLLFLLGF